MEAIVLAAGGDAADDPTLAIDEQALARFGAGERVVLSLDRQGNFAKFRIPVRSRSRGTLGPGHGFGGKGGPSDEEPNAHRSEKTKSFRHRNPARAPFFEAPSRPKPLRKPQRLVLKVA
jgi:hypothetical protein